MASAKQPTKSELDEQLIQDGDSILGDSIRQEVEGEALREFFDIKSGGKHDQAAEDGKQDNFSEILKTLGLNKYYPSKISLLDAMAIKTATEQPKLVDLPWEIIHKLLMIDFHARDQLFEVVTKSSREETPEVGGDFEAILFEMQNTYDGNETTNLNPLDVLVAIFTCCDNFLRQTLAQKLFVCKLAIPFLYPLRTEGTVGMSLWALRTITVQHKEGSESHVTEKKIPLVTFVRLGRPPLSKSKLMNDILRDDSHDTFFHHDCNNGTVDRRITNGLVECSWFITAGKENENLPGTTMFLNLRGDASLMKKQMQILQEMSSVVFAIVTAEDLAETPNSDTCRKILQSGTKVILFLISGNDKHSTLELVVASFEAVGKDILKGVPIILSSTRQGIQKNASDLKIEAREKLSEVIVGCSGKVIENCAQRASEMGIIIDEYVDKACHKGKRLAERVVSHMEGTNMVECKDLLLPLQGAEWIEYCKLLKEQHRASGKDVETSSAQHADKVKQKMNRLREKQVKICHRRLSPFIIEFMAALQNNPDVVMYFLKWMTLLLDEKSRATLPGLRRQYNMAWTKFQDAKKKQEKEEVERLKSKVDNAEKELASASLGLENVFREIGQIYEAVNGSSKRNMEYLPEIAAKQLLRGISLELVDGDASSVPIAWVTAVLSKLGNIIGEKKLFVLSVLGIQSSGKSTLLNTMFGLQFAVSAGRCTRGAYMQLIPVDEHADLPFDYVVVVDTEGLRAPELGQLKYEHDNELATLAIGLGDVTMINIKGENTAEMKDILQIAVHALLRMKLVKKNIQDHRTCIFVHQNVPAANAEELMMHGCQKLQEGLDDMAKEAAHSENITDIHSFSQIIEFDVQKHVWYFSDLWHGNPPMAHANPGYSEKVGAVRSNLLGEMAKRQTTFLAASDLSIRLADLWNGVLADDFVFSFRNSLEVKAYNNLQSKYYNLEWKFQNKVKSWLHTAEIELSIQETVNDLNESFQSLIVKFSKFLDDKAEETKTSLKDYFRNCNLQEIVIQWQESKLNQLSFAVVQQRDEGKSDLLSIKKARQVEILHSEKWSKHESDILSKAVKLADKLKGKEASDNELERQLDIMWKSMLHELPTDTAERDLPIALVMEEILLERFHAHGTILRKELKHHPLSTPLEQGSLKGSITVDTISKEHISLKSSFLTNIKRVVRSKYQHEQAAKQMTAALTEDIMKRISDYLKDLSSQDVKLKKSHAIEVVAILVEKIATHNHNDDCNFTILPEYSAKLAVHVSRYCVQVFTQKQLEYNRKHSVKAKLQEYKNTAWSLFKNMVKQSTEEKMAGDLLCTHLKGIVQKAVMKAVPRECINEVLGDFQMTKYYLMVKMMDDLAVKGNFANFMIYIRNAKEFALEWITTYTNDKMFSRKDESGISRYAEITTSHIGRIIRCIAKSVKHATTEVEGQRGMNMATWIKKFCHSVSEEIAVPISTLTYESARPVVDFSNLQRIILEQLVEIEINLMKSFANETEDSVEWNGTPPPQQILDRIWGCPEQCPFCSEPCTDTTPDHYKLYGRCHMCVQHRPMGIRGIRTENDGELRHESCNYKVQLEGRTLYCSAWNFKCRDNGKCSCTDMTTKTSAVHKYTEYKIYLPDWDIAPDRTNDVSKYWMWFMATYQHQLKNAYNAQLPDIPGSWKLISKDDGLTDLRRIHH